MTRSFIPRILIPAVLIAAAVVSLFGRLFANEASTLTLILVDNVPVTSCGATWTTDNNGAKWIACGVVFRNGFEGTQ